MDAGWLVAVVLAFVVLLALLLIVLFWCVRKVSQLGPKPRITRISPRVGSPIYSISGHSIDKCGQCSRKRGEMPGYNHFTSSPLPDHKEYLDISARPSPHPSPPPRGRISVLEHSPFSNSPFAPQSPPPVSPVKEVFVEDEIVYERT